MLPLLFKFLLPNPVSFRCFCLFCCPLSLVVLVPRRLVHYPSLLLLRICKWMAFWLWIFLAQLGNLLRWLPDVLLISWFLALCYVFSWRPDSFLRPSAPFYSGGPGEFFLGPPLRFILADLANQYCAMLCLFLRCIGGSSWKWSQFHALRLCPNDDAAVSIGFPSVSRDAGQVLAAVG